MQYIINIKQEQDLQFLLAFFERMQIDFRPLDLPKKKPGITSGRPKPVRSAEIDNSIENLLRKLGSFTDAEFADQIESNQLNWKNWTAEKW